jgi:hypothetical protein
MNPVSNQDIINLEIMIVVLSTPKIVERPLVLTKNRERFLSL